MNFAVGHTGREITVPKSGGGDPRRVAAAVDATLVLRTGHGRGHVTGDQGHVTEVDPAAATEAVTVLHGTGAVGYQQAASGVHGQLGQGQGQSLGHVPGHQGECIYMTIQVDNESVIVTCENWGDQWKCMSELEMDYN